MSTRVLKSLNLFQLLQKRNRDAFALRRTPRWAAEPPGPPEGRFQREGWAV